MPRSPDFFDHLSREALDALHGFAREPGVTVDDCVDWLCNRGIDASRAAVGRWKKKFDATEQFRASNDVARAMTDAARGEGAVAISDAAALQLSQMLFEQLLRLQSGGEVSTRELWGASMALKNVAQAKGHVEKLKEQQAAALKVMEREARQGASGEALVARARELLGIR